MHPTDGEILAALDGWGDTGTIGDLERHLTGCDACSTRKAELGRERNRATELLAVLDTPVPERHVEAIVRRSRRRRSSRRRVIAAAAALLVATAAAATIRAGGVHQMLERMRETHAPVQPAAASAAKEGETTTGIALEPEGNITIEFAVTQPVGEIHVELSAEPRVTVTAPEPVPYSVQSGRIRVENQGRDVSYHVMLPSDLRLATITVAGQVVFSKKGREVVTEADRIGDMFNLRLEVGR